MTPGMALINIAVARARAAMRDAMDNSSSYVHRDIHMIERCAANLNHLRMSRQEFEATIKHYDLSFTSLAMSGYLVEDEEYD